MMKVAIAINNSDRSIVPLVVSLFTWARAYHVELVFSDNTSIIADASGVRMEKREYNMYEWILLPVSWIKSSEEKIIRAEAERIANHNDKYDWLGAIFGKISNNKIDSKSKWFCSEIVVHLLSQYTPRFLSTLWWSPDDVWKGVVDTLEELYPHVAHSERIVYFKK